ncbi:permease [Fervidicella metallireducens AeB]|uniref:Permease n=1 Tax=Fervidicella metallireducens AeB TaxID=1403537 RepID=A0A017RS24_9CLOT|nr:permease [Fervidicella metallireducens]EYE87269.1 permease [Fervidicella metallireducens AeB]
MIEIIKRNKLLAVVSLTYIFLFIAMPDKAYLSVKNSIYYIIEMLEIMPVIFILTSIIEAWVPKEVIINGFGEKAGIKGSIFSFLLGSFSAGPIYAAFPICRMLLKKGASIVNVVIILSAWAVIKIPMLANEAKFLGLRFMGIRWILTVISILIISYIVAVFVKKEDIPIQKENNLSKIIGINIKKQYCIGCGLCEKLMPQYFKVVDKKAKWKEAALNDIQINKLKGIMDKCPVKAIDFRREEIICKNSNRNIKCN